MDLELFDVLSPSLQREVADDIARRSDKQSIVARKQRKIIAKLADVRKRGQGKRNDLRENTSCTSNRVQVSRRRNTTEIIAEWYDEGASAVYQRIEVLEAAEKNPEKYGRFLQEMDEADSPHVAHKHLREAQRREEIARDETPDERVPVVRHGDRWILGKHVLVCGDATSAADVNKLLAGATPHLMVTDPPYGVEFDAAWRSEVLGRPRMPRSVINDDRADWRSAYALFPGDVAYAFSGTLHLDTVIGSLEAVGLERRDKIVCVKPQFVLGRGDYQSQCEDCWYVVRPGRNSHWNGLRDKSNVWMIKRVGDGRDDRTSHGTQKPVECMLRPIENSSKPGDSVYDPFVGSGTTIIAAEISGRCCYAMDIDPIFCTVAIERWQKYTGQQARLGATGQTFDAVKAERSPVAAQAQVDPPLEIAVAEESSSGDQV
jgi:hypothetical protein